MLRWSGSANQVTRRCWPARPRTPRTVRRTSRPPRPAEHRIHGTLSRLRRAIAAECGHPGVPAGFTPTVRPAAGGRSRNRDLRHQVGDGQSLRRLGGPA